MMCMQVCACFAVLARHWTGNKILDKEQNGMEKDD